MTCPQIKKLYKDLIEKKDAFFALKTDFKSNREQAVCLQRDIERIVNDIEKIFGVKIKVENMPSPFAEVYDDNKLARPEKETQRIDLEKQLEEDCQAYRDCGLESWADDIEKSKARLREISKETKAQIAKEIQNRAIPIFMPGRAVQYANLVETLTKKLKPQRLENGKEKTVDDSYLKWEHLIIELQKIAETQTAGIPEEPYLMLTKPSQRPIFTGMKVDEQIAALVERNEKRRIKNKCLEFAMMPAEYASMQTVFTVRAKKNIAFKKLDPLDVKTHTRFVSIPLSLRGFVSSVHWNQTDSQLYFHFSDTFVLSQHGIRLVVRISL